MSTVPAPVGQKNRIDIIDIIRGVALLGILMMNVPFFADSHFVAFNPLVNNETGINYNTWLVVSGFFEGTMRALFTMLFGAGCLLLLSRLEKNATTVNPADIYYRRILWLLLFGLFNAFVLLWPGDILYAYAISGLFLFPFRNMKAKYLFMIGAAIFLLITLKDSYRHYAHAQIRIEGEKALAAEKSSQKLSASQEEAKTAWVGMKEKSSLTSIRKEAEIEKAKMQGDYAGVWSYLKNIIIMLESTKFYSDFFPDIICLLFLGMGLFKTGVLTALRSKKFYWCTLVAGYGLGLWASYVWLNGFLVTKFDPTLYFQYSFIDLYQAKRFLLAIGHLSVIILLYKYGIAKWLLTALKRVGQMAFSNYLMQSIICTLIFYGYGFGLYGKLERHEQYLVMGAIWIFQMIVSSIWLRYYRFGPFEWLWRSLTYWKKQPMKKNMAAGIEEGEPVAVLA